MMQFLKSILLPKRTDNTELKKKLEEASVKIECLEEEIQMMATAISEISGCLTSLAEASQVLAQDVVMITSVIQTVYSSSQASTDHFKSFFDSDDDDYLN